MSLICPDLSEAQVPLLLNYFISFLPLKSNVFSMSGSIRTAAGRDRSRTQIHKQSPGLSPRQTYNKSAPLRWQAAEHCNVVTLRMGR